MQDNSITTEKVKQNQQNQIDQNYFYECKREVRSYIGHQKYRLIHIERAKRIGHLEELLLADLIDFEEHLENTNQLISLEGKEGLFFYYDHHQAWKRLGLTEKQLFRLVKNLVELEVVSYCMFGIPGKRHFQINYVKLSEISKNSYIIAKRQPCTSDENLHAENDVNSSSVEVHSCQTATMGLPNGNRAHIYKKPYKNPKLTQSLPATETSAIADEVKVDKISEDRISDEALEVVDEMVKLLQANNPTYRPPKNLIPMRKEVKMMVDRDKQDPKLVLKVFKWAIEDNEERGGFKGWSSVLYCNNPAKKFRDKFPTIYQQMISRPKSEVDRRARNEDGTVMEKPWLDNFFE